MDGEHRREGRTDADWSTNEEPAVSAHESRPGRIVFTERGNTDAWIASDLTVDPEA